jgi:hypothetical protein
MPRAHRIQWKPTKVMASWIMPKSYRNEPRWKKAIREEWIEIEPGWWVAQKPTRTIPWWRQSGHLCGHRVRAIMKYGKKDAYSKCSKCGEKCPENVWLYCYLHRLPGRA